MRKVPYYTETYKDTIIHAKEFRLDDGRPVFTFTLIYKDNTVETFCNEHPLSTLIQCRNWIDSKLIVQKHC